MCLGALCHEDGVMNDTHQSATGHGPDDDFDAKKLRTITDMRRSSDDRIVAGVCSGAARYLNIDPVIIRVVLAVLTLAGFAGAIIYIAAWLLLPSDDVDKSLAAEWFNLDKNEEQIRVGGMIAAIVLAALSAVGDGNWSWWGDAPWWLVPFAVVAYFVWIRPRRRRQARAAATTSAAQTVQYSAAGGNPTQILTQNPIQRPKSQALLALTMSLALIAMAATWIYEETHNDLPWTTYVAVALGVVAFGLVVGTFFGQGGWLITIGLLLAATLTVGTLVPDGGIGEQRKIPTTASQVDAKYKIGIGLLELDLTQVGDPTALPGRTVRLIGGIGEIRVLVPRELNLDVYANQRAGEMTVFGRSKSGTNNAISQTAVRPAQPAMTIEIDQQLGSIEVIRK